MTRIQKGSVNTEVVIALQGGNAIAATITNESTDTLGLTEGSEATAVFKAGAVLLGGGFLSLLIRHKQSGGHACVPSGDCAVLISRIVVNSLGLS